MERREVEALRVLARACLEERDVERKIRDTLAAVEALRDGTVAAAAEVVRSVGHGSPAGAGPVAGLPPALRLAAPTGVARRGLGSRGGLAAFVHAIAHIEWNAINLAWDAVWRFDDMPGAFHREWAEVAAEEARHFAMLRGRLRELGSDYGDLPAHGGLWEMAEATADDVLARMALVPRVLEARGLDVTPGLIARLRKANDESTAAILEVVLTEEIGHVALGSRWFHWVCRQRGVDPAAAFEKLLRERFRGRVKAPLTLDLRRRAGFSEAELEVLARVAEG